MSWAAKLVLIVAFALAARAEAGPDDLFARTAREILRRDFRSTSYLMLDLRSGAIIAQNWNDADQRVPIGSLAKPFTAIAYAEAHDFQFPEHTCSAGACWLPRGHGRLGIVRATAFSCNSYYEQLAARVTAAQVTGVARRFGLNGPGAGAGPEVLIGMHGEWSETPLAIARAYAELLERGSQAGVREIVAGMGEAARNGTASGIGHAVPRLVAVAKTGTAPCTHAKRAPGDGFVVVAWPGGAPRCLLLARQHGVPGAQAAVVAGRMLRALERPR